MKLAIADPPYPGCAHLYKDHPDYAGEVDHAELIARLQANYDGWALHTSSVALGQIMPLIPAGARVMAWVKPFAAFKRNVPVAYAWEPVIVRAARKPVVRKERGVVMRDWIAGEPPDWIAEPITMKRGLTGVKPRKVCRWVFEMLGAETGDTLDDLYPGTGAITAAWNEWRQEFSVDRKAPAFALEPQP